MNAPAAEIITIGTELLLGEIVDTNTHVIAQALRAIGLDLYRTTTVGDNAQRIALAVGEASARAQVVITTGGLGPTVDDITREGIARAFDLITEFRPELWAQIQERFARFGRTPTENNRRQAMIPHGAIAIENPVGTAPCFIVEREGSAVIALPGVPAEMSHLLDMAVIPYLRQRLDLTGVIKTRLLRTAGEGESWIDQRIEDLERLENPTVGLSAHPGRVDIRITAKAASELEADELIQTIEANVRQRLGEAIYGTDEETLEAAVLNVVANRGWRISVVETGTGGALTAALAQHQGAFAGGHVLTIHEGITANLKADLRRAQHDLDAEVAVVVALEPGEGKHHLRLKYRSPVGESSLDRSYGGPAVNAGAWTTSIALEFVRRRLA